MPLISGPVELPFLTSPAVVELDAGPWPNSSTPEGIAAIINEDLGDQFLARASNSLGADWAILTETYGANSYNYFDQPNNRVICAVVDVLGGGIPSLVIVDLGGGGLTRIAGPGGVTAADSFNCISAALPNGDLLLGIVKISSGSTVVCQIFRYRSGAWSGPFQLTDTATHTGGSYNFFLIDAVVDVNSVCYISYNLDTGGNTLVKAQSIDASNTLSSVSTIATIAGTNNQINFGRHLVIFNNQLWHSVVDPNTQTISVYRTSGLSLPASWTLSYSTAATGNDVYAGPNLTGNSILYVVWNAQTVSGGNTTSDRMMVTAYSGSGDTWGTAQTALDWVNNPPAGMLPYPAQSSHFWSTHQLPNGTFGTLCDFNNPTFCFAFYTSWSVAGPAGSAAVQVGGGAGAAGAAIGQGRFHCCVRTHEVHWTKMAEAVRRMKLNQQAWPYLHEFAPPVADEVNLIAIANSLTAGSLLPVLSYTVPLGMRFFLEGILQDFAGAAFNPGDALWTIDRNASPLSLQSSYVQGLIQVPVPLGSFTARRQWWFKRAYEFGPNELVRSTVINVNLGVGAGNVFISGFFGYLVPTD